MATAGCHARAPGRGESVTLLRHTVTGQWPTNRLVGATSSPICTWRHAFIFTGCLPSTRRCFEWHRLDRPVTLTRDTRAARARYFAAERCRDEPTSRTTSAMKYRLVGLSLISAVALWGCGDDEVNVGAQPAASVHIDGLSANATAYFDDAGVLNASCQTDEDCAAVLGYFHARDRFVQMDLRRRITTGRLTQMLKESVRSVALPIDIKNRALYSTRDGEPVEDAMLAAASDKTRALFDAYARGVNAWIADLKAGRN
ncbi:MAG TPA: hypothetical protein ENK23_08280, partial [Sorangium sp.]|nr:hypothetical protein [Sorangium sp.]